MAEENHIPNDDFIPIQFLYSVLTATYILSWEKKHGIL